MRRLTWGGAFDDFGPYALGTYVAEAVGERLAISRTLWGRSRRSRRVAIGDILRMWEEN